jgi:predicted dehydrogenase
LIRIAIIGTGGYAYGLIQNILNLPEQMKLVAARSNPKRKSQGAQVCKEKGIPVYDDIDKMLDDMQGQADVIMVPTPIGTHFQLAKQCLNAGYEVFLEKPPVATIQQHDELLSIAKSQDKQVPVMFQSLYSDLLRQLQKRIISGEFGEVKRITAVTGWTRPDSYFMRNSWAGKLNDNGEWVLDGTVNNPTAHTLSNELFLASKQYEKKAVPQTVKAELYKAHNIESEDTSCVRIITEDNVEVFFTASLCSKEIFGPEIKVQCELADINYSNYSSATIKYNDCRKDERIESSDQTRSVEHMLLSIAECYEKDLSCRGSLEICRPFTLTVNSAFESSGFTHQIPAQYLERLTIEEEEYTYIRNLSKILKTAFTESKLFSEIGVPWAISTVNFNLKNYKYFVGG